MISISSVLSALFLYSVALAVVCGLRRWTGFLKKDGVGILLMVSALAVARLVLPIEISVTYAVRSWAILGAAHRFLRTHPTITRFLLVVWVVGAVVVVWKDVADLRRARRRCYSYTIVENEIVRESAERLSITCPVRVSPNVKVPYVSGILRPTIYLPDKGLSEEKIELALAHEAQHIRSHDALIKLFFGLVSAAMWWNPITHWYRREIDALLEFRCDAKVTAGMDKKGRRAYLEMLLEVAKQVVANRRVPALALDESSALGKTNVLEQRFQVVLGSADKRPRRFYGIVVRCIMLAVFCVSYLVVVQPAGAPSIENFQNDSRTYYEEGYEDPEIGDGTNYSCIIKGADGRYQLFVNYRFSKYLSEDEVASDQYRDVRMFEEAISK